MALVILGVLLAVLAVGLLWLSWPTETDFYLYFANETQAQVAIVYLKRKGFRIESRLSGDEEQWLVLASKSAGSLQLFYLERVLNSLAASNGGEYDGYERAI